MRDSATNITTTVKNVTFFEFGHDVNLFRVMIVHVVHSDDDVAMVLASSRAVHVEPQRALP